MPTYSSKVEISGLSRTELTAYLTILDHAPLNGSPLSRRSGITWANAYDALRALQLKVYVAKNEVGTVHFFAARSVYNTA